MHELGNTLSDQDVNAVASQHFDAQQVKKDTRCTVAAGASLSLHTVVIPPQTFQGMN